MTLSKLRHIRPASFVDHLIGFFCRRGWWALVEGISYHLKSDHLVARVAWKSLRGNTYFLSPVNYIDRLLLSETAHDPEVIDFLEGFVKPDDVVWDIGANIGYIALEVAASCPQAKYYCFEPSPLNLSQLLANASASGRAVNAFSLALSDRDGCLPLMVKFSGNVGQTGFVQNQHTTYDGVVHVGTVRGDTLVELGLAKPPTVIKLDVEGHESEVLAGLASQLASGRVRAVVYESCDLFSGSRRVPALLQEAGFILRKLPGNQDNWAAVRELSTRAA